MIMISKFIVMSLKRCFLNRESYLIIDYLIYFCGSCVLFAQKLCRLRTKYFLGFSFVIYGKVIEEGTHEELLNLKGKYHALYQYQN